MRREVLIFLDKTVFRLLFFFVTIIVRLFGSNDDIQANIGASARILVIRPGGLGDGIMSVPFLRRLRELFPGAEISLLCVKKNRAAIGNLRYIDRLIVLDAGAQILENLRVLLFSDFDVVFDLEPFRKVSSLITWITGARIRVGFDTNNRRRLYTHIVSYANERRFEGQNMLQQLGVIGDMPAPLRESDFRLPLEPAVFDRGVKCLEDNGANLRHQTLVAVAVGVLKPQHRWSRTRFAELIDRILEDDCTTSVVLVGSPSDAQDSDAVLSLVRSKGRVINLVGACDFETSMGVLSHCRVLIACDGGIVYMAACVGCATVSLWGPGVMERFKPPGERHIGVRKNYACIPCVTWDRLGEFPACPYNRRCYTDLTVEDVYTQYQRIRD
jgi:ADP-heptose:LPS heptosyltransferase